MSRKHSEDLSLQNIPENSPVTILKTDNDQFLLEIVRNIESQGQILLLAGDMNSIFKSITHEPAETVELETAIEIIEDQLMPVIKRLPKRRYLVTSDQAFWKIARVAGIDTDDHCQLDIQSVEEIFNRLVDVAYGTPASILDVPKNREFAAAVLFLRELMRHAGFYTVYLSRE